MGKSIAATVGQGSVNLPIDVGTVQYLLNCVPESDGGPVQELVMDGLIGPLTLGAINRFQGMQLGFRDGRVDPESQGGKTIVRLNMYDPTPSSPSITPQFKPRLPHFGGKRRRLGKGAGRGKKHSGSKP